MGTSAIFRTSWRWAKVGGFLTYLTLWHAIYILLFQNVIHQLIWEILVKIVKIALQCFINSKSMTLLNVTWCWNESQDHVSLPQQQKYYISFRCMCPADREFFGNGYQMLWYSFSQSFLLSAIGDMVPSCKLRYIHG